MLERVRQAEEKGVARHAEPFDTHTTQLCASMIGEWMPGLLGNWRATQQM